MSDKQPDWDKITEGKIRHGIAVEAFSNGMELNADNMKTMEKWVQFVIHGYDGIKEKLDAHKETMSEKETIDKVKETFDGKESKHYIVKSMRSKNSNKRKKKKGENE